MDYKKARLAALLLAATGITLALFLYLFGQAGVLFIVVIVLALGALGASVVIMAKYYRCPHCAARLSLPGGLPDHCPRCGKSL